MSTDIQKFARDLIYQVEMLKLQFTENIVETMEDQELSKSDLAKKMKVTPAFITKILSGNNNFTMETMVKIGLALDQKISVKIHPLQTTDKINYYINQRWTTLVECESTSAKKGDHERDSIAYAA